MVCLSGYQIGRKATEAHCPAALRTTLIIT